MEHRPISPPPTDIYPVDPWRLIERGFLPDRLPLSETLFALANGYLGVRGSLEEGDPAPDCGTFINGFYETWPINYPEEAFGLPALGQSIVTLPDATALTLHVDGEPMRLTHGRVLSHERELDMQSGVLTRQVEWESPSGTRVRLRSERLVSFLHRHLVAFRLDISVLAGQGPLTLVSGLVHRHAPARPPRGRETEDPRRARDLDEALVAGAADLADQRVLLEFATRRSGLRLACGTDHRFEADCPVSINSRDSTEPAIEYRFEARPGSVLRFEKFAAYHTSADGSSNDITALVAADLDRALAEGFDAARNAQREYLDGFWQRAGVRIDGDAAVQQAVRWNLFQLAQATLRTDGLGVPAKGLTGRGYDGHYFWDVEIYVQPFLTYAYPEIARRLLGFRHGMVEAARRQARVVGERGALFPWRTINGEEASGNYPTSTAQYHINADVVHALRSYVQLTGDRAVLTDFGAEILVETARLWVSLGFYPLADGAFHIHGVTGPDEYTAVVDDNAYTNLMARENLVFAADVVQELREHDAGSFADLAARLELREEEPDEWRRAAERMFIPYDAERRIHPQDVSFLNQEPWDFAGTPPDHYPLLLHYHPLVLHRHQVVKQADVVLAMLLAGDRFSAEQRLANFLYYEPITTADSSLSHAIQTVAAAEAGSEHLAVEHFKHALFMDLTNWAGNAEDGVHIASAGGVWLALVYGFAGLRDYGGQLSFEPHLPAEWTRLAFALTVRNQAVEVEVTRDSISFRLREGEPLTVSVRGERVEIRPGEPVNVMLAK
jgi:alpha,alpha-trehalose phosphorylase